MKRQEFTVNEAAKLKGCTRQAVHAAIKRGQLLARPEIVPTTVWRIDPDSLAAFQPNPNMKRSGRKTKAA